MQKPYYSKLKNNLSNIKLNFLFSLDTKNNDIGRIPNKKSG